MYFGRNYTLNDRLFLHMDSKDEIPRLIIRILHECEVLIEKSVPRVTVWHHEAPPSDAKL